MYRPSTEPFYVHRLSLCRSMNEAELVATSVDDLQPEVGLFDVTTADHCDDITGDGVEEDAFLRGFRDCRRAALRFLRQRDVDVGDDLERHLTAVERTCRRCGHGLAAADAGGPRPGEDDELDVGSAERRLPAPDRDDSALGVSLVDADEDDTAATGDGERGRSATTTTSSELVSESAGDLLRLAQNNPRINNILNELFTLMDQDDVDDDDDVDSDCVMTSCDDDVSVKPEVSSPDAMTSHDAVTDVS